VKKKKVHLSPFTKDTTSELDVFWHDGNSLRVDSAQAQFDSNFRIESHSIASISCDVENNEGNKYYETAIINVVYGNIPIIG
jgi:hypothetical protein